MLHLPKKTKNRLLIPSVFLFFLLINLATNGGHTDMSDGFRAFLYTENLVLNGKLGYSIDLPSQKPDVWFTSGVADSRFEKLAGMAFDKNLFRIEQTQDQEAIKIFLDNKDTWISDYLQNKKNEFYDQVPLALPIIGTPFYLLALTWELNPLFVVPFFVNSIVIAAISLVIFVFGSDLFKSKRIGFVLALIFGLTSFMWPYISTMYSRPLASLFVILCIYLIFYQNKKPGYFYALLASLSLGLSIIAQPHMIMISPILGIYGLYKFRKNKKQIIAFIFVLLIMIGIVASANYYRFDNIADFGFPHANQLAAKNPITNPAIIEEKLQSLDGLYGNFISPGKSIFVFFPLALLLPFSLFYFYKDNKSLALVFIFIIFLIFLWAGTTSIWDKLGSIWGPHRYLLPILPLVTLSLGSIISRFPRSAKMIIPIVILGVVGFIVNLIGNLSNVRLGIKFAGGQEWIFTMTDDIDSYMAWNPEFHPLSQAYKVLSSGYIEKLTNCSFDIFLYCNYGLQSILVLGILIAIVGVFILYLLGISTRKKANQFKTN